MSEKTKKGWRKVKNLVGQVWWNVKDLVGFIYIVLLILVVYGSILIVTVIGGGVVLCVCWNISMTTIFGFSKITILQAIILFYTIDFLRRNYFGNVISDYEEWRKRFKKNKNEKMVKVASVSLVIIFEIIWIVITVLLTMYSWNNILLQILNLELVQINFLQALGFAYFFNLLFARKSGAQKSKESEKAKNSDSKDVLSEAKEELTNR